MSKRKYLKGLTFDFEPTEKMPLGPHISYTTPAVGGAASGLNSAILLKSDDVEVKPLTKGEVELLKAAKEVVIELSMVEFLRKFMGLYWDDAQVLAAILGFENTVGEGNFEDYLEEKVSAVTIVKGLKLEEDFYRIDSAKQMDVLALQEKFEKGLVENEHEVVKYFAQKIVAKPESKDEVLKSMDPETKEKVLAQVQIFESRNDKTSVTKGDKMENENDKSLEEINKSLKADLDKVQKQLDEIEKQRDKEKEKVFVAKAKEYEFTGENAEALGKILKSLDEEDALLLLDVLDAAKEEVTKASDGMFVRKSVQGESQDNEVTKGKKAATRTALMKRLGTDTGDDK